MSYLPSTSVNETNERVFLGFLFSFFVYLNDNVGQFVQTSIMAVVGTSLTEVGVFWLINLLDTFFDTVYTFCLCVMSFSARLQWWGFGPHHCSWQSVLSKILFPFFSFLTLDKSSRLYIQPHNKKVQWWQIQSRWGSHYQSSDGENVVLKIHV